MAILKILHFPDPRLRRRAAPVAQVDDAIRVLIDNMFATMYQVDGVGLAATQVNVLQRVVVIDVSPDADQPMVLVNPQILESRGEAVMAEGCLSVPGARENVTRAEMIRFQASDRDGKLFEQEATGLLAACVQHEIDHLDGKLFVDYLSGLKRQRIRKQLEKQAG
ncbi:MAG: peptide deformylase [Pseudomonadota bacterium]